MMMFFAVAIVSCQKDEPKNEHGETSIIGMWKAVEIDGKPWESVETEAYFMEFAPNGWFYKCGEENGTRYQIEGNYFKVLEDDGTLFNWVYELSSDNQYLTLYAKNTMKFKRFGESNRTAQTPKEIIRGTWTCKKNAYGDPWDDTKDIVCKIIFSERYVVMNWYLGSQIVDSYIDKNYEIKNNQIVIENFRYPLEYKLTNNDNTLTIYGLDNNDMAELTFERAK